MSGTELGRVMAEVTAQPPADVDFGAVEGLVRRRRARTGALAGGGAAAAVAVIVAVPLVFAGSSSPRVDKGAPSRPTRVVGTVDPTWIPGSWGEFSWRQPRQWKVVDTGLGNHSRLSNDGIEGPFLTTVSLGKGCYSTGPNSGACNRRHVLQHIPADGVVAELIGSVSDYPSTVTQPEDPGTLVSPDSTCAAWGGASSFTATRTFGPADDSHELQIVGCLGSQVVNSGAADLRAVLASVTDASFNAVPVPGKTATAGDLTWQLPNTWRLSDKPSDGRRFMPFCGDPRPSAPRTTYGQSCGSGPLGSLADGSAVGWFSDLTETDRPKSDRSDYPQGNQTTPSAECEAAGGAATFTDVRHLGPVDAGEWLTVTGCVTSRDQNSQVSELRGILNSAVDTQYPDPRTLCSSVSGTVESSVLATVGGARILSWGTTQPAMDAFPEANASEYAAWCWVRDNAAQKFHVWLAHRGDPPVKVVDVGLPIFSWNPAPSVAPTSLIASSFYTLGPSPTPAVAPATPSASSPEPTPTVAPAQPTGVASGNTAKALCASALGTYATAELTTVDDIRTATVGPLIVGADGKPAGPLAHAFKGAAPSDKAAWCWALRAHDVADVYAVRAGDKPLLAASIEGGDYGSSPLPSGPPNLP
jgi:hypothetical protein